MVVELAAALGLAAGWVTWPYVRVRGGRAPRVAVAVGAAVLWGALAARYGPVVRLGPAAGLALGLLIAACVDLATHRIPNPIVLAILVVGAAAQAAGAAFAALGPSLLAALVAGGFFAAAVLATRGGFGWGDAKLAAALAWVLGPAGALTAIGATALAAGLVAAVLLATRLRRRHDALPYAPFLLVGGLVALFTWVPR